MKDQDDKGVFGVSEVEMDMREHFRSPLLYSKEVMTALLRKLANLSQKCSYIQKDGVNQFHRYNYATAALVYEKVNSAMFEEKLVSTTQMRMLDLQTGRGSKGVDILVTVLCELQVFDVETGACVTIRSLGQGQDPGDKAIAKAQTMALKYAWINALNISTGDDPEGDAKTDASAAGKSRAAKEREERGEAPRPPMKRQEKRPPADAEGPATAYDEELLAQERGREWMLERHKDCRCGRPMVLRRSTAAVAPPGKRFYLRCSVIAHMWSEAKTPTERDSVKTLEKNHDFLFVPARIETGEPGDA